ncbi:MAG TPA: hypothetical protein VD969_21020 [Symbiobacteriaceae bacterium]|nr:hypothetical protein [Symbiobacteriaceae bacterium]
MGRNPRHFAGLAGAVLTVGSLLALSIFLRGRVPAPAPSPEVNQPAFRSGSDLNGDGQPESIRLQPDRLIVMSPGGSQLLDYAGTLLPGYQIVRLGGEYPVLLVRTGDGEYAGFAFDPGAGLLQMVAWPGGQMRGYGELTADGGLRRTVVGSGVRRQVTRLALNHLRLEDAGTSSEPLQSARPTPAEALAAAVETAVLGLEQELSVHFPDAAVAREFYARWHGKLPPDGTVRVARTDEVNAGAEHGHRVPVTIWVSGQGAVAGLSGDAEFVSSPEGVQIRRIRVDAVPLAVASWTDAAGRVGAGVRPSDAPFYGVFRFEGAGKRWAVDAVTGKVEQE